LAEKSATSTAYHQIYRINTLPTQVKMHLQGAPNRFLLMGPKTARKIFGYSGNQTALPGRPHERDVYLVARLPAID
jgi:hypothetical protein